MTLLTTKDFEALLDSGEHLANQRLKDSMKDVPIGEHEALMAALVDDERAFWEARGVDVEALTGYCLWEAHDSVRMALRAGGVPEEFVDNLNIKIALAPPTLRALIASTVEMAFSVGWHMHDRMLSKVSH